MRIAGRQKGSKVKQYTHVVVQPGAPKSRYTFSYHSSEKGAKAAQKKYEPLVGNPLRVVKQSGKSANTDMMENTNTESLWANIRKRRAAGKPKLKPGQKGYPKTLNIEKDNPRIPRKKGQPAGSDKHSDLYTDENPKGTIKDLGFKDVETAKASVAKIKSSGKTHAHKIQAAIAMEQRARVMGKTAEAAVYRKYINAMKKKTKKMQKEDAGVLSVRQQKERIKRLDMIRKKRDEAAKERQKAADKINELTGVGSIPNPATTAMGPTGKGMISYVHDRRKRKKDHSTLLKRFRDYFKTQGVV